MTGVSFEGGINLYGESIVSMGNLIDSICGKEMGCDAVYSSIAEALLGAMAGHNSRPINGSC